MVSGKAVFRIRCPEQVSLWNLPKHARSPIKNTI